MSTLVSVRNVLAIGLAVYGTSACSPCLAGEAAVVQTTGAGQPSAIAVAPLDAPTVFREAAMRATDPAIWTKVLRYQRTHLSTLKQARAQAEVTLAEIRKKCLTRLEQIKEISEPSRRQMAIVSLEVETRSAEASVVAEVQHIDKRIAVFEKGTDATRKRLEGTSGRSATGGRIRGQKPIRTEILRDHAGDAQKYFDSLTKLMGGEKPADKTHSPLPSEDRSETKQ